MLCVRPAADWANFIDIGGKYSGHIVSVSNSVATIPGIVGNVVAGWLLHRFDENYAHVFTLIAAVLVLGLVLFLCTARATTQRFE